MPTLFPSGSRAPVLLRGLAQVCLLVLFGAVSAPALAGATDMRLLIDVSGSMRHTDPDNLRRPATELVVQLLPEGSRAGLWTFGEHVRNVVAHAEVDNVWRLQAGRAVDGIHSREPYTDIGAALAAAAFDADRVSPDNPPHIIMLTDGVVDISDDMDINRRERQRVLNELLPELRDAGYRIHTIALSRLADHDLMRDMALATDGVYEVAETADELMGIFLRIFDQVLPSERLPIVGNQFLVDDSVEEFTALVFRGSARPTRLISPSGADYEHNRTADGINWHRAAAYDLVTVADPEFGLWTLEADLLPGSRVTVVSNLQLQVAPLPNNLALASPLTLAFALMEDGVPVVEPDFLRLLSPSVQVVQPDGSDLWTERPVPVGPSPDGRYSQLLPGLVREGVHWLQLRVDGKTFQREYRHSINVHSQLSQSLTRHRDNGSTRYRLQVTAPPEAALGEDALVIANIRGSDGFNAVRNMRREGNRWHLEFTPRAPARYSMEVHFQFRLSGGSRHTQVLQPLHFTFPEPGDGEPRDPELVALEQQLAALRAGDDPDAVVDSEVEPTEVEPAATEIVDPVVEEQPPRRSWPLYLGLIFGNLLLLLGIYAVYRWALASREQRLANGDVEEDEDEGSGTVVPMAMDDIAEEHLPDEVDEEVTETPDDDADDDWGRELENASKEVAEQFYHDDDESDDTTDSMGDAEEPLFPLDDETDKEKRKDKRDSDPDDD